MENNDIKNTSADTKNSITKTSDLKEECKPDGETQQASQTAEAEKLKGENSGSVPLGKFKDAQALLKAYESLEAEFTKKCQKLSKVESLGTSGKDNDKPTPPPQNFSDKEFIEKNILTNRVIVDRVICEYLKELSRTGVPKTISGNNGVMPMISAVKPKTIAEAGILAEKLLKGKM